MLLLVVLLSNFVLVVDYVIVKMLKGNILVLILVDFALTSQKTVSSISFP